ncbi:MAG: hypothetical protein OHK93_001127 [Ramalina farinacea]|uniref:Tryptophan synthase beta chain-like PALP domain-containing protein n=1 Tax=Ramalina farinacea TaxID=258253 RepID=A0AA43QNX8_9LECA|nr:hypothetical protein [Ramalina farinacea]
MAASSTYHNPTAHTYLSPNAYNPSPSILALHRSLPSYAPTPLISLPTTSPLSGICAPASSSLPTTHPPLPTHLFLKDESLRFRLPAFKILGASYACFRALGSYLSLDGDGEGISFATLQAAVSASRVGGSSSTHPRPPIRFHAATDGNFGRAVARMAALLGVNATIYVPKIMVEKTRGLIRGEGADMVVVDADYDGAVGAARRGAEEGGGGEEQAEGEKAVLIQDDSWEGYVEVPQWVVDGYSTMLVEIDSQVASATRGAHARPTHIIVPVGVGSLAHAVVAHYKSSSTTSGALSAPPPEIIAVEPDTAACLQSSLKVGKRLTVKTGDTEMCGMNCGTVSYLAWPHLRDGVDASVTVMDGEAREALKVLGEMGVRTGPCSSGTLAALLKMMRSREDVGRLGLGEDSVVVLLGTEGPR